MLCERFLVESAFNYFENAKKFCETANLKIKITNATNNCNITISTKATTVACMHLIITKGALKSKNVSNMKAGSLVEKSTNFNKTITYDRKNTIDNNNCEKNLECRESNAFDMLNLENDIDIRDGSHKQSQQQQPLNIVKLERLRPSTNSDLQMNLVGSRCVSTSPSLSKPPQIQTSHSIANDTLVSMQNLSTSLLSSIKQTASTCRQNISAVANTERGSKLSSDFSARNCSDIMRSLAAKYKNETIPSSISDTSSLSSNNNKRPLIAKTSTSSSVLPTLIEKAEVSSEPTLTHSVLASNTNKDAGLEAQIPSVVTPVTSVSPIMISLLNSLPLTQNAFPPLFDMSCTQALVTLARAVKEAEVESMMCTNQQSEASHSSESSSSSPDLSMALQQAAQFVSPTLMYAIQIQSQSQPQASPILSHSRNNNVTNLSSSATISNKSGGTTTPLDLSSQPSATKRKKVESTSSHNSNESLLPETKIRRPSLTSLSIDSSAQFTEKASAEVAACSVTTTEATTTTNTATAYNPGNASAGINIIRKCQAESEEVSSWTVDEVCEFVSSIDICTEYAQRFRDQSIDGTGLPLLTEDHLVHSLGMKLGPALKLRSILSKKLGGPCPCVACTTHTQQILSLQAGLNSGDIRASTRCKVFFKEEVQQQQQLLTNQNQGNTKTDTIKCRKSSFISEGTCNNTCNSDPNTNSSNCSSENSENSTNCIS